MGYWTGAVDGLFDPATRSALIAFQKWEGRTITGTLTIEELEAIRKSAESKANEAWPKPGKLATLMLKWIWIVSCY
jgi:peptidoglycan hydrolase-like protein with peptidoglycan-binding domain